MFRGISVVQLDDKSRMAIPARYRETLQAEADGELVVTIDTEERCLLLYQLPDWEIIEKKIEALPSFNPIARRIQRLLIGHATEVELDANNRLLLPAPLREYAGIEKGIVLVGQGKKFEIWDETHWKALRAGWLESGLPAPDALPADLQSLSL